MTSFSGKTDWITEFRALLRFSGHFEESDVDELVSEVEGHLADASDSSGDESRSRETYEEFFGTPQEYVDELVREQVPVAQQAKAAYGHREHLVVSGVSIGLFLVIFAVAFAVTGFWSIRVTTAGLVGCLLLWAASLAFAHIPDMLRATGRPRWGYASLLVPLVLVGLMIAAFVTLPRRVLGSVPVVVLGLAGVLVAGVFLRLGMRGRRRGSARGAKTDTPNAWISQLEGLLVGRHDLPRPEARRLVADTESHLRSCEASHPADEFGPVEQYALRLAEGAKNRPPFWRRANVINGSLSVLYLGMFVLNVVDDPSGWLTWMYFALFLGFTALAFWASRQRNRRARTS